MSNLCRCQRCRAVVSRSSGPLHRKVIYVALYALTLPYAWLLFVAGPGVLGVLPIVMAIGLGISAGLSDWAFPDPNCPHCKAALEWAPAVTEAEPAKVVARAAPSVA